jgi:hypothetical protein
MLRLSAILETENHVKVDYTMDETGDHFRVVLLRTTHMPGQATDIYRTSTGQAQHP